MLLEKVISMSESVEKDIKENKKLLFKYYLEDAWCQVIYCVSVYVRDVDNVILEELNVEDKKVTLSDEKMQEMMDILNENNHLYDISKVEAPTGVLDGVQNLMYFSNLSNSCYIYGGNLWAFSGEDCNDDTRLVIDTFNKIAKILKKKKIEISLNR